MEKTERTFQACFRVPEATWKAIKHYAVQNDLSMQDTLTEMLATWLKAKKITVGSAGK